MSKGLKGLWILLNLYHFFNTFSLGGVSRNFVVTDAQSLKLSSPTTSRDITNPQLFLFPTVLMPGNFLKNSGAVAWNGLDPQVFQIDFHNFGVNSGGVVFLMFFFGWYPRKRAPWSDVMPLFFFKTPVLGRADLSNICGKIVKHEETEHLFCSCHSVLNVLDFRVLVGWKLGLFLMSNPDSRGIFGFTIWFNVGFLHWSK